MSLQKFKINDHQAINKAKCEKVPNLMVIAGPNGVGKSTLLEAIRDHFDRGGVSGIEGTGEAIYFSPHRAPLPTPIEELTLVDLPDNTFRESLTGKNYKVSSNTGSIPRVLRGSSQRSRNRVDYAPYYEFKRRIGHIHQEIRNIAYEIMSAEDNERNSLPDVDEPLRKAISEVLPGLEFIGADFEDKELKIYFRNRGGEKVEYDSLSSGEKDVIAMLFLIVEEQIQDIFAEFKEPEERKQDQIILIDSPEAYLHPSLQEKFFEFLENAIEMNSQDGPQLQVVCCTHSQTILQNSSPEEVFFLLYSDQAQGNQLKCASDIDRDLLTEVSNELGYYALASGKPLLLVEGKTDKGIIKKIYEDIDEKVQLVSMGGKKPIKTVDNALNQLLETLKIEGFDIFALLDRDREWDLQDSVQDNTFVLPGSCIENILLVPDAIFEAIKDIKQESELRERSIYSSGDVSNLVNEIIQVNSFIEEELRLRLNDKLSPLYFDTRDLIGKEITKDTIESLMEENYSTRKERIPDISKLRREIESDIDQEKWEKLNGKYIFSKLSDEFSIEQQNLEYLVAANMTRKDLPGDLDEFIQKILQEAF